MTADGPRVHAYSEDARGRALCGDPIAPGDATTGFRCDWTCPACHALSPGDPR